MSNSNTYQSVWKKFLPVIALKLKMAVKTGESQSVAMDKIDFENAGHRKNNLYRFELETNEGRTVKNIKTREIGFDFARALNEYEITKELIKSRNFKFNLSSKFVLTLFLVKAVPEFVE